MAAAGARRRRNMEQPAIPMAPLIDIVFLLLVFFMLVTKFLNPSIDLSLPESSTAEVNDERSVMLAITADGALTLDGQPVVWDALTAELAAHSADVELVRVRADAETPHREVVRAFDCIRTAGLFEIALEASPAEED